jgi:hypothetical protein
VGQDLIDHLLDLYKMGSLPVDPVTRAAIGIFIIKCPGLWGNPVKDAFLGNPDKGAVTPKAP